MSFSFEFSQQHVHGFPLRMTLLAFSLSFSLTASPLRAQDSHPPPVRLPGTELHLLTSSHVDQTYQIQVALPDGYADTDSSFPVLYLLDADRSFGMATDIARWLAWADEIPDVIVVGVAYGEGMEAWWQKRSRDYTQSPDRGRPWGEWPLAGGADAFADFLQNELFPFVEGRFRTVAGDRTVLGISFGGLFGAHVLFTRPELFQRYLILSPALAWDNRRVFEEEATYGRGHRSLHATVYTAVGSLDNEQKVLAPWRDFVAQVEGRRYEGLSLTAKVFQGETHISVFPVALAPGLKTLFSAASAQSSPADLLTPRYNFGATVHEGRIYAVGGTIAPAPPEWSWPGTPESSAPATASIEAYEPETNTWTDVARLSSPRTHASACTLDGLIYVVGGAPQERVAPLGIVEAYDPATGEWTRKADLPTPRMNVACVAHGGKLLAIGGQVHNGVATVEEYDPATDSWRPLPDMPTPRAHLVAEEVNGRILAIGGAILEGVQGVVEEYDPVTEQWWSRASMPTPRTSLAAAVLDGRLYVIGGSLEPGGRGVTTVEVYDPATDSWPTSTGLAAPRAALAAVTLGNRIYAIGGATGPWPFEPLTTMQILGR